MRRVFAPLALPIYRRLWTASIVSNLGTMMHAVGAAWLMTQLTTSPIWVAMVPVAALGPSLVMGLPGGVLADHFDRRLVLAWAQTWMMFAAAGLGVLAASGRATPLLVVILVVALGSGNAITIPTWQSLVQDIVPPGQVASAVALGSISFNAARMVGPAVGGVVVAASGPSTAFFINSVSFLGVVVVLLTWRQGRPPPRPARALTGILRGIVSVASARHLRGPFARVVSLCFCASAIFALLPLFAREQLGLSPAGYGGLLGVFGAGALVGSAVVPALRNAWRPTRIVALGGGLTVLGLCLLALPLGLPGAVPALFLCGSGWTSALNNLNVSVQTSVPGSMRGRALSCYFLLLQGGFAAGAATAGFVAKSTGIPATFGLAAATLAGSLLLTSRLPLPEGPPEGFGEEQAL